MSTSNNGNEAHDVDVAALAGAEARAEDKPREVVEERKQGGASKAETLDEQQQHDDEDDEANEDDTDDADDEDIEDEGDEDNEDLEDDLDEDDDDEDDEDDDDDASDSEDAAGEFSAITKCVRAFDEYKSLHPSSSPGAFATNFAIPLDTLPLIDVKGVGELSFPIPPSQCRELISVATQAPFGKGEQTVVDTTVRNTFQINADAVTLDAEFLTAIRTIALPKVCAELGVALGGSTPGTDDADDPTRHISCHLYKLLVYEEGGFFLPHRDSEKEDGMFGTMVVILPSRFSGGDFIIEHGRETRTISSSGPNGLRSFACVAFYASCKHEIKPVTSGYRVALTFNLCRVGNAALPSSPSHTPAVVNRLGRALSAWVDRPQKRCCLVPFDHMYTLPSLEKEALKGKDCALLALIRAGVQRSGEQAFSTLSRVLVYLCVFEYHEYVSEYDDEEEEDDEDDASGYEVTSIIPAKRVSNPPSSSVFASLVEQVTSISLKSDGVIHNPSFSWSRISPYSEKEEYTGNEGIKTEMHYRHVGILLVPCQQRWNFVVPRLSNDVLMARLKKAIRTLDKDSAVECVHLVRAMSRRERSMTELSKYARELAQVRELVKPSAEDAEVPSASASASASTSSSSSSSSSSLLPPPPPPRKQLYDELAVTINDAFKKCPLDVTSYRLFDELNAFVAHVSMNVMEERLRSAFAQKSLGDHFTPQDTSRELNRLFNKSHENTSARWRPVVLDMCSSFFRKLQQQQAKLQTFELRTLVDLIVSNINLLITCFLLASGQTSEQRCADSVTAATALSVAFAHVLDKSTHTEYLEATFLPKVLPALDRVYKPQPPQTAAQCAPMVNAFAPLVRSLKRWLEKRLAEPLPAASSWAHPTRPSPIFGNGDASSWCTCGTCNGVASFLQDAAKETHAVPLAERDRKHVEQTLVRLAAAWAIRTCVG